MELEEQIMSVIRERLGVRVGVSCTGDTVNVKVSLVDLRRPDRSIDEDSDSDSVTIYQDDIR